MRTAIIESDDACLSWVEPNIAHWLYPVPMTLLHYNSVYLTFPSGQLATHLVAKASVGFGMLCRHRLAWTAAALFLLKVPT